MELSTLIKKVEEVLIGAGLSKKSMQLYKSFGFTPITRFYIEKSRVHYSEKISEQIVSFSRRQYEDGEICCSKFQHIRKVAEMLKEYNRTGSTTWHNITPWHTQKLGNPFAKYLQMFESEKLSSGYSVTTMRGYKPVIKHFLLYFETLGYENLLNITNEDIVKYIPVLAQKYSRMGDCLSRLRSFSEFLTEKVLVNTNISTALPVNAPTRKKYSFGFTREETEEILSAVDRTTTCGKRDYAILILAKYTGLRAIDILNLKFDEIDWHKFEVKLIQHKTGHPLILPLETRVCNAIADYILNGRPKSDLPFIFLRSRNPYLPLKSWSGYSIVKRNAAKVGITWSKEENKGLHSFRRSLGSWMLEAEVSIDTIKEVLGHRNRNSTKPYIATHQTGLLKCAMNLDGIDTSREELL